MKKESDNRPTADGRIKPDVCARGVATVAATPYTTDGFSLWNGTSLSCPLAAGAVALIIQAHPEWSPLELKEAVLETASRSTRPDIRYGWGVINARDAINYPSFSGYVIDRFARRGLACEIRLELKESGEILTTRSEESGEFLFANLPYGSYAVVIEEEDYLPYRDSVDIPPSQEFDIILQRAGRE